jgi:hypothetical protein
VSRVREGTAVSSTGTVEGGAVLPEYQLCFTHAATFDDPLALGDAIRWTGPQVWRVDKIDGTRVSLGLWPDEEPYPERIKTYGPGEWPASL